MRALLCLLLLVVALPARAQGKLTLEFAQDGDPSNPRALIVIHRGLTDRSDLKPLFPSWARSWGVNQLCSLYSYTYPAALDTMPTLDSLGGNLLTQIQSNDFDTSGASNDPINPYRRVRPTDPRQPMPYLMQANKLVPTWILAQGTGGLIGRELIAQAAKRGLKIQGITYLDAPLDGVPMSKLNACMHQSLLAGEMGLSTMPSTYTTTHLSPGWIQLTQMWDAARGWNARYAAAYQSPSFVIYSTTTPAYFGAERVQYGRGRSLTSSSRADFDGWVSRHSAQGDVNGPTAQTAGGVTAVAGAHNTLIGQASVYQVLIGKMLPKATWAGFLMKRAGIEMMFIKADKGKPLGMYYDESATPQWKPAYALPGELYKYMWIGG